MDINFYNSLLFCAVIWLLNTHILHNLFEEHNFCRFATINNHNCVQCLSCLREETAHIACSVCDMFYGAMTADKSLAILSTVELSYHCIITSVNLSQYEI